MSNLRLVKKFLNIQKASKGQVRPEKLVLKSFAQQHHLDGFELHFDLKN